MGINENQPRPLLDDVLRPEVLDRVFLMALSGAGDSPQLRDYIYFLKEIPRMKPEKRKALFNEYWGLSEGDKEGQERGRAIEAELIERHLHIPLASLRWADKFGVVPFDDLVQEAHIALWGTIRDYRPNSEISFWGVAAGRVFSKVSHAVTLGLKEQEEIPVYRGGRLMKILAVLGPFLQGKESNEEALDLGWLAEQVDLDPSMVAEDLQVFFRRCFPDLDRELGAEEELIDPHQDLDLVLGGIFLDRLLEKLTLRQRSILTALTEGRTGENIGQEWGIHKTRVSQILREIRRQLLPFLSDTFY